MTAKILVTGASGFVGRHFLKHCAEHGVVCKVVVRKTDAFLRNIVSESDLYEDTIENAIKNPELFGDVDTVVHLAARVHNMNETQSSLNELYNKTNCALTLSLASAALKAGVKTFIFASSVKVIGDSKSAKGVITESDMPSPTDPYGKSKYEAEKQLEKLFLQQGSSSCIALRFPMVYGPGNKGNMLFLLKAASHRIPLPLKGITGKRSMIYVGNICDALVRIVAKRESIEKRFDTFYLTDGIDYTSEELYSTIYHQMNGSSGTFAIPIQVLRFPTLFNKKIKAVISRLVDQYRFSSQKFERQYNWQPPVSLRNGISETVEWFKKECM